MNNNLQSHVPEVFLLPGEAEFQPAGRRWQGIASMERSREGRLFCVFYSGGETEQNGNYIVLTSSDDDGATWTDPLAIIRHPDVENIRLYDPNVWLDPLGRLWVTWACSRNYFDGRNGVWETVCDQPDAPVEQLSFSMPRRIANGIMMCKPTVLKSGAWLFPCAVWACMKPSEEHPECAGERFSNVYASYDNGETFALLGGADVPNRCFDEHMVVERRDGALWMLVRRYDGIGEAFSYDGGRTWWQERLSDLGGPNSRFFIRRLHSGNLLMVNHFDFHGRNNLMAKLSFDDGRTWTGGLMLDERADVSYPDGTQDEDGFIYIAYDHERYKAREILMAKFTEKDILATVCENPNSRLKVLVSQAAGELPVHHL